MNQSRNIEVSIITPAYNAESFIGFTIESVKQQNFQNWEMLIVDDHSSDNTVKLVKALAADDWRIQLLSQDPGEKGPAAARNKAISMSRGRFIAFLDSDDLWHPQKLEIQIKHMKDRGEPFTYTRYFRINENGNVVGACENLPASQTYRDLLAGCPIGCLTVAYDTHVFGKVFMPDIQRGQDYGLWLRLLRQSGTATLISATLAYYRVGRSASLSAKKWKKAKSIWTLYRKHEKINIFSSFYFLIRQFFSSRKNRR